MVWCCRTANIMTVRQVLANAKPGGQSFDSSVYCLEHGLGTTQHITSHFVAWNRGGFFLVFSLSAIQSELAGVEVVRVIENFLLKLRWIFCRSS